MTEVLPSSVNTVIKNRSLQGECFFLLFFLFHVCVAISTQTAPYMRGE